MAANITPVATTGKSQGKGGKKSATPSRSDSKRQAPVRPVRKGRTDLVNVSQMLAAPPMQVSQAGVPYRYIVPPADSGEDPGFLRPPTRQDVDYGERLRKAMAQKKTGVYPMGWDPVVAEQRITAADILLIP